MYFVWINWILTVNMEVELWGGHSENEKIPVKHKYISISTYCWYKKGRLQCFGFEKLGSSSAFTLFLKRVKQLNIHANQWKRHWKDTEITPDFISMKSGATPTGSGLSFFSESSPPPHSPQWFILYNEAILVCKYAACERHAQSLASQCYKDV